MAGSSKIDGFRDTLAELKVIAYAIRKDHRICDDIDKDCFSIGGYRLFFDIINSAKTTFPKDILESMIKDRIKNPDRIKPWLLRLYKVPISKLSIKNINSLVKKLKNLAHLRISIEQTEKIIDAAENGNILEVKKAARKICMVGISDSKRNEGFYLQDFENRKSLVQLRASKGGMVGVPTGIRKFDIETDGVMKGELAVIIGESGIGKSIALENISIFAWENNYNVLYITIEMTKDQVGFRMDSRLSKILYSKFRKGELSKRDFEAWDKEIKKYRATKDNFFKIVALARGCTTANVESEADKFQDTTKQKLDLLVVDYLNIMHASSHNKYASSRDWQAQALIANELKEMAVSFSDEGVAMWTGNQVTDEGEGKSNLKKSHVKYGRGIVEVADIVTGLTQSQDDELEDIIKFQVLKARDFGMMDPIILRPNYEIMTLDCERSFGIGKGNFARDARRK